MKQVIKLFVITAGQLTILGFSISDCPAAEPLPFEPVPVVSSNGPGAIARQPQAAVDLQGRIHIVFGHGNEVRCASSTDAGRTYALTTVGKVDSLALGMRRGPRIAATSNALIVTAIGGKEGNGRDGDILAWRSVDAGRTWTEPKRINAVVGAAREGLHGIAAHPNGEAYCVWLDLRNKRTEIFGASSKDGGLTWEPDRLIYRSPERSVCECCHPSVAFAPDGTIYVMWRNQIGGARDLYLARSNNSGQAFDEAVKLGKGSWSLNACPMDGGAVAAGSEGRIETVWMRAGAMYTARPGEPERKLGRGVQGWTAFGPEGAYTVWLDRRPGKLLALVPGAIVPIALAEQANDPVIAAAPNGRGPVVVVWESRAHEGELLSLVLPSVTNNDPR